MLHGRENKKIIVIFISTLIIVNVIPTINAINIDETEKNCDVECLYNSSPVFVRENKGIGFVIGENFSFVDKDLRYYYFYMENFTIYSFGLWGYGQRGMNNRTQLKAMKPKIKLGNLLSSKTLIICRYCDIIIDNE